MELFIRIKVYQASMLITKAPHFFVLYLLRWGSERLFSVKTMEKEKNYEAPVSEAIKMESAHLMTGSNEDPFDE